MLQCDASSDPLIAPNSSTCTSHLSTAWRRAAEFLDHTGSASSTVGPTGHRGMADERTAAPERGRREWPVATVAASHAATTREGGLMPDHKGTGVWMKSYVGDWGDSIKTTCFTLAQEGAFVRLLCTAWERGGTSPRPPRGSRPLAPGRDRAMGLRWVPRRAEPRGRSMMALDPAPLRLHTASEVAPLLSDWGAEVTLEL